MGLKLFLDSADRTAWAECLPLGLFAGVTTNPSLLKASKESAEIINFRRFVKEAEQLGIKELHLQAWGETTNKIIDCGFTLAQLASPSIKVFVKIPITKNGTKAAKTLIASNIAVTLTACFEAEQALIASALGASYIAAYLGRINDHGKDGEKEIISMQKTLKGSESNCQLLVASIRNKSEITRLSHQGINNFTIRKEIAQDLFNVKATIEAADLFEKDAL